jgi:hypothetical protein
MEKNQKLPVLGELEATDPKQIVTWAKKTLTCGKAFPKTFERINVLHFCVSKDIRDMWAALTEGVEGAPADDYPSDIDSDSKEEEELAKKRDWHYEWLETVISYYGTNQKDDVYEAIRRRVEWSNDPSMQTGVKVRRWALACSRAQNAVAPEAWDEADPKTLFTACAKVLPEPIRTLLQQNKPEGGQHTWQTAAKFLDQRTMACEADDVFRNAVGFVGPESSRSRSFGNSNSNSTRMASNGSNSGAGEAPRALASAAVGVVSGATRMRLPTKRRSLMPARAKAAVRANLAKAKARRAASQATSASVTEKVTQMQSLPRRRRRTT